jgi:hypothetical protein
LTLLGRLPNLRRPLIQGESARRHFSARQKFPGAETSPLAQRIARMKRVAFVVLGLLGAVSQTGCSCCCFHDWFAKPAAVPAPTYCPPPAVSTTAPTYYVPQPTAAAAPVAAPAIMPAAAPVVTQTVAPAVQTQPCVYTAPVVQQQPCCVPCTCTCQ